MLMGRRKTSAKKYARRTFNSVCYGYVGGFMQYAIPLLLTALLTMSAINSPPTNRPAIILMIFCMFLLCLFCALCNKYQITRFD